MPITVGGGVRSVTDVGRLLSSGADKVAIRTAYGVIQETAKQFGCQAIVASIDYGGESYWMGREKAYALGYWPVRETAQAIEGIGAGEILLTSIEREGTMQGYDLDLIREVSNAVDIPVIAHGGCSGPEDMLKAIEAGASAVAAGALFQFTEWTPRDCVEWLDKRGVEVRL